MNDILGRLLQLFSCFMWGGAVWIMLWAKLKKPSDAAVAFLVITFVAYANADMLLGNTKLYAMAKANKSLLSKCVMTMAFSTVCFFRNPVDILAAPLVAVILISVFGAETIPLVGPLWFLKPRRFNTVALAISAQVIGLVIGLMIYLGCVVKSHVPDDPDLLQDLFDFATGTLIVIVSRNFQVSAKHWVSLPLLVQGGFCILRPILYASVLAASHGIFSSPNLSPWSEAVAGKTDLRRAAILTCAAALAFSYSGISHEYSTHTLIFEFLFGILTGIISSSENLLPLLVLAAKRVAPTVTVLPVVSLISTNPVSRIVAHSLGVLLSSRLV